MAAEFDWHKVSEVEKLAFYGALLALAAVDGGTDKEEMNLIFETLDLEGLSEGGKRKVHGYAWELVAEIGCSADTHPQNNQKVAQVVVVAPGEPAERSVGGALTE